MTQSMRIPLIVAVGAVVSLGTWLAGRRGMRSALWSHAPEDHVTWIGMPAAPEPSTRGGWLGDVGLFYRCYLQHAAEALERMNGTLVHVSPERPGAGRWR